MEVYLLFLSMTLILMKVLGKKKKKKKKKRFQYYLGEWDGSYGCFIQWFSIILLHINFSRRPFEIYF